MSRRTLGRDRKNGLKMIEIKKEGSMEGCLGVIELKEGETEGRWWI